MFNRTIKTWGYYIDILRCKFLCVKILHFNAKRHLSKQRHFFRNEIWICLYGWGFWAETNKHKQMFRWDIRFIRKKEWHQFIAMPPTSILEIQFGLDVREDDIERI